MMFKKRTQGFTLVELIIVIAIIAVLASLAFMALSGETAQARDSKRLADLKVFEDAIATANGKNKKVNYLTDVVGKKSDGTSRSDTVVDDLETSAGVLQSIRGANLVTVSEGMMDSDVLPTAATDPKGSNYFAAYLSSTDYSLYGTLENPNTKIPTAVVRGTFKEGSILDVLTQASSSAGNITVANPERFVRGDVLKIDDEYMVVLARNTTSGVIEVDRGYITTGVGDGGGISAATQAVHNIGASVKIISSSSGGKSLTCLGPVASAGSLIVAASAMGSDANTNYTLSASAAGAGFDSGDVCDAANTSYPIVDNELYLPYKIN